MTYKVVCLIDDICEKYRIFDFKRDAEKQAKIWSKRHPDLTVYILDQHHTILRGPKKGSEFQYDRLQLMINEQSSKIPFGKTGKHK